MDRREVRFDDIDGLKSLISDDYGPWSDEFEVGQDLIQRFADLTGDHQWIHVDVERASEGPYGAPIAHGLLLLSLASRVRPKSTFAVVGQGSTVNYGSDGLRFQGPVMSGARIRCRNRVRAVEQHKAGTRLSLEIAMHVVGKEQPSMLYSAVMLYVPAR